MKFGPNLLSFSIAGMHLILKDAFTMVNIYKGLQNRLDSVHYIMSSSILENNYPNSHSNGHPSWSFKRLHDVTAQVWKPENLCNFSTFV